MPKNLVSEFHAWYVFRRIGSGLPMIVGGPCATHAEAILSMQEWNARKRYAATEFTVADVVFPLDLRENE